MQHGGRVLIITNLTSNEKYKKNTIEYKKPLYTLNYVREMHESLQVLVL